MQKPIVFGLVVLGGVGFLALTAAARRAPKKREVPAHGLPLPPSDVVPPPLPIPPATGKSPCDDARYFLEACLTLTGDEARCASYSRRVETLCAGAPAPKPAPPAPAPPAPTLPFPPLPEIIGTPVTDLPPGWAPFAPMEPVEWPPAGGWDVAAQAESGDPHCYVVLEPGDSWATVADMLVHDAARAPEIQRLNPHLPLPVAGQAARTPLAWMSCEATT